jgi:hypothetical protein
MFHSLNLSLFKDIKSPSGLDAGTSEIISRLKFIGRLQKGEKINVRYMYVQSDSLLTRLSRTFFATDNRSNTFNFIDTTINRSFEIISLNRDSTKISEQCLVANIIKDLRTATKGINNLIDTYKDDVMFCCKLDTLIQDTFSRLTEIEHLINPTIITNENEDAEDPID